MSEKNNSNRFGIRTLELTIKVKEISISAKRVIYEEVHSTIEKKIKFFFFLFFLIETIKANKTLIFVLENFGASLKSI